MGRRAEAGRAGGAGATVADFSCSDALFVQVAFCFSLFCFLQNKPHSPGAISPRFKRLRCATSTCVLPRPKVCFFFHSPLLIQTGAVCTSPWHDLSSFRGLCCCCCFHLASVRLESCWTCARSITVAGTDGFSLMGVAAARARPAAASLWKARPALPDRPLAALLSDFIIVFS